MGKQRRRQPRQRQAGRQPTAADKTEQQTAGKQRGRPRGQALTVAQKILQELTLLEYVTIGQLARLLAMERSRSYLQQTLSTLIAADLVFAVPRRAATTPHVYTPTTKGREYINSLLGTATHKRFRPAEERDKARNEFFLKHTIAVTDVLVAARLLAQTTPGIVLTRIVTERALKRQIYVELPVAGGMTRQVCIEPDASLDFLLTETRNRKPETWQDFLHIEVYRTLPPAEWRFKQKIHGYVTYAVTGQHEALFQTPALSIAVCAATDQMATTLKRWTEEVLVTTNQQEAGDWFFFCSVNPATATPEELFLAPVWEQAFGSAKTPLLMLKEEAE